jgi:hypothetical protein
MADPIITPQFLAAAGAGIGALMKPRNPLQGALLGGIAGYSGGQALGFGATAPVATTGATTAAGGAGNSLLGSEIAAQRSLSYAGGNLANTANMANTGNLIDSSAGLSFGGRSAIDPTMINATNAAPSFIDKIAMSGKNAYENPMMTAQALSATNSLLQPEQMPQIASAPAMPVQAGRGLKPYDPTEALNPYRQSVIGGQPISLLG